MTNNQYYRRIKCVEHYLSTDDSLRKTAKVFNVHYRSVYRWVKWFRQNGVIRLCKQYKKPWNRIPTGLEKKIVQLKEHMPYLTLKKAQMIIRKQGCSLSLKGIWCIWKRYGYCGFRKQQMTGQFVQYGATSAEANAALMQAEVLYKRNLIAKACAVLNRVPFITKNDLISKLPDGLLNIRRRVEKLSHLYGTMDLQPYLRQSKAMYENLKRDGYNYSAIRCGVMNIIASSWSIEPERELTTIRQIKGMLRRQDQCFSYHLSILRFFILITEGIAWIALKERRKAERVAQECRKLLRQRRIISPSFLNYLGILCTYLEEYKAAALLVAESYSRVGEEKKKYVTVDMIKEFIRSGSYQQAEKLMKQTRFVEAWGGMSGELRCKAILSLVRGMPHESIDYAMQSLALAQKGELTLYIYYTYLLIACAYSSIGERTKALDILDRLIPYLKKQGLENDRLLIQTIIQPPSQKERGILRDRNILPRYRLLLLLKYGQYNKACQLAIDKGMLSYFHRYILFFAVKLYEKEKANYSIEIPDSMLQLPVFSRKRSVYFINFLGPLKILKDQKPLRIRLFPKDAAFLIHCACRAPEPGTQIPLTDIFQNFWPHSQRPSRNLSHMLVRLRKLMKMTVGMLGISRRMGQPALVNKSIYFATDYGHLQETLIRIRALERAEEWEFAKKEYLHAFKLFRREPFKKMYDPWSEQMRLVILNKLETEAIQFVQGCLNHGNRKDGQKVIKKVLKIISDSEKIHTSSISKCNALREKWV